MPDYRERTTGEVKTQSEWRQDFSNTSLPQIWKTATLDFLNIDAVLPSPEATTTAYQVSVRDGVVQNANGNWVHNNVARDMFSDYTDEDGVLHTKAEQETAYQATLDATIATDNRNKRNQLLADSDWTQMNDSPLSNEDKTAWSTYRQELRDVSDLDAWPNMSDEDWPVVP